MRKLLWLSVFIALAFALGTASATPTYCVPGVTTTLATDGAPPTGATITCGSVVFSNFTITNTSNAAGTSLTYVVGTPIANILQGSYYDGGLINLVFNPNELNSSVIQDVHITFDVSAPGSIFAMGGSAGVKGVQEIACSGLDTINPGGACINGGVQVGSISFPPTAFAVLGPNNGKISIWKDGGHDPGSSLSGFTETFLFVPEPATFAMLGGGLLLFSLARRKKV